MTISIAVEKYTVFWRKILTKNIFIWMFLNKKVLFYIQLKVQKHGNLSLNIFYYDVCCIFTQALTFKNKLSKYKAKWRTTKNVSAVAFRDLLYRLESYFFMLTWAWIIMQVTLFIESTKHKSWKYFVLGEYEKLWHDMIQNINADLRQPFSHLLRI